MYTKNVEILKKVLANKIQRLHTLSLELNQLSKETSDVANKLSELGVSPEEIDRITQENYLY